MTNNIEHAELAVVEGSCSFCAKVTHVVRSPLQSKAVCFKCIYKMNFQLGKIPAGAVRCFKCRALSGFQIQTRQGKQIAYRMVGRDFKGCVKYEVQGIHVPKQHVVKVTCSSCGANIPKWVLEFTSHV